MSARTDEGEDWWSDSVDPDPRIDGKPGPPDDWPHRSWFDRKEIDWYWDGRPDPCPVRPIGFVGGVYIFISADGEIRKFTSAHLHASGGLTDLFGGALWWPLKHFRKINAQGELSGPLQREGCAAALIRACRRAGYFDGSRAHRGVGTWRGPGGKPVVHSGDRVFVDGVVRNPGIQIGEALFLLGGARQPPLHVVHKHHTNSFEWQPAGPEVGHEVAGVLHEWNWEDEEARDLFQGGLFCDLLGAAPRWKPHKFVRAPAGAGKSTLLKYARDLLGGAAHPIARDYRKAFLEQYYAHTACALLLDEAERGEGGVNPMAGLLDLVKLLSDDGASGGRGSSHGQARSLDLHGTVTMIATVTDEWRHVISSRVTLLELRSLKERTDHPPIGPELMESFNRRAAELSPGLRARAIARYDLFEQNISIARKAILQLGGTTRDADQLGHLIAGWSTMISDDPLVDDVNAFVRFKPYIVSLTEAEEGEDEPSKCFNVLLGLSPRNKWIGGEQLTIGQMIARARAADGSDIRRTLQGCGLRLDKLERETWDQAWLAIANNHPALDVLFENYPLYRGPARRHTLKHLAVMIDGVVHSPKRSENKLRFGGAESRALLIPPELLPSYESEKQP